MHYDKKLGQYINALYPFPLTTNFLSRIKAAKQIENDFISSIFAMSVWSQSIQNLFYKYDEKATAGFHYMYDFNENDQWETRSSTAKCTKILETSHYSNEAIKKTYELCQKNGINLLFLLTTYQATDEHISHINSIKQFAQNNSIPFLDLNNYVEEIGIDMTYEMRDWGHTLISGANKNSRFLAKYLINQFGLSSKKNDSAYSNWNKVYAEYVNDMQNNLQNLNLSDFLRLIAKEREITYKIIIPKNITNILIENNMCDLFMALFNVQLEKDKSYTICNSTNFSNQMQNEEKLFINYSFSGVEKYRVWGEKDL